MNPLAAFAAAAHLATQELRSMTDQMRNASRGGMNFDAVGRGMQLLGQTVGVFLTPLLNLFGAGLMTVADMLNDELSSSIDGWVDKLTDAADWLLEFAGTLQQAIRAAVNWEQWIHDNIPYVGGGGVDVRFRGEREGEPGNDAGKVGGEAGGGGDFGNNPRKKFGDFLGMISQEMKMSIVNPSYSSIADANRRMQMQSYQSQLQQKFLSLFMEAIKNTDRIARGVENIRPAVGN